MDGTTSQYCLVVLVDMPLQSCMEVWDSTYGLTDAGWSGGVYWDITLLILPSKAYARVLERRLQSTVTPQIQREQC